MPGRLRAISKLVPYFTTTAVACLIVLAVWGLVDLLMAPKDTVVIQVVPLGDDGQIRVQVDGAVERPGVYLLPPGSTEADAIAAAGGFVEEQPAGGDLARQLADGDLVRVGAESAETEVKAGPVDINTAGAAELETLPGIGPVLAGRVIEYRERHGPFKSPRDLAAVSGISERMVSELEGMITAGTP